MMIHTTVQQNSEQALLSQIYKLSDAGAAVIQVRTREPIRTALVLRKSMAADDGCEHYEWDIVNGMRQFTLENYTNNIPAGKEMDVHEAFSTPLNGLRRADSPINTRKDTIFYYVYVNPHPYLANNPLLTELIQQYAAILPSTNVCIIMVTPEVSMDSIPAGTILVTEMKTPSAEELEEVLSVLLANSAEDFAQGHTLTDEDIRQVALLGLGLTLFEFETYASLAIVGAGIDKLPALTMEIMSDGVAKGKTEVVKQSEILELYPTVDMAEVGGMARLKDWVESRKACYTEEAREFGIESPKGMVVVGVPGTGKSLVAKAVASTLGIPLVRFDFGRVFSKFVGDSESRVRSALAMVEAMAPCVLFIDEIDKGLSGSGGGGDSGVTSRVLGTFLTWLNDSKAPVFNMVTANKVDGLPPELLRKGRFDQIFSVGMPGPDERAEVLDIHLRKRGHEIEFSKTDQSRFREYSDGYVPAEIEAAVKDGLILAFNEGAGTTLQMKHIVDALQSMIPMSKSNATQIDAIVQWATHNAIPVNYSNDTAPQPVQGQAAVGSRRLRNRG